MSATDTTVMTRPASTRRPVEGPSAWTGADMRQREAEWSYRLSPTEIAEIETATQAVRARGLDLAAIGRADFRLPTLGPILDRLCGEGLNGRGFVMLRGMPVENRPIEEAATAYWGIGTYFGAARSQNAKGHLLGHIYDLGGSSATDPHVRSYATAERQNYHIDRCDVVALLCLKRAMSGGLSAIVSSMTLHNVMAERRPDPVDRRAKLVAITDAGRTALDAANATWERLLTQIFGSLSQADRETLLRLLGSLDEAAEQLIAAPGAPAVSA